MAKNKIIVINIMEKLFKLMIMVEIIIKTMVNIKVKLMIMSMVKIVVRNMVMMGNIFLFEYFFVDSYYFLLVFRKYLLKVLKISILKV